MFLSSVGKEVERKEGSLMLVVVVEEERSSLNILLAEVESVFIFWRS
jgi:hypothetical protein